MWAQSEHEVKRKSSTHNQGHKVSCALANLQVVAQCSEHSSAMAAAPLAWKAEVEALQEDGTLPITTRCGKILEVLRDAGLAYKQKLQPKHMLIHTENRSGQMVSVADVHSKGAAMSQIGFSLAKLGESVCFELPVDYVEKEKVVQANKSLSDLSENMVSKPLGTERFASVSTSHTTAFLKAVEQSCKTCEDELSVNGFLSMETMLLKGDDLKEMISEGWEWVCISCEVEKALPHLPAFLQQALNSALVCTLCSFSLLALAALFNNNTNVLPACRRPCCEDWCK